MVQQHILDKLYSLDVKQERELFHSSKFLFEKSVAIDLDREFAHQRKPAKIEDYFDAICNAMLLPLRGALPENEIETLQKRIAKEILTPEVFAGMYPTIEVSAGFGKEKSFTTALASQNREASRVQAKQQERVSEKVEAKEQENMSEYLNQVESRRGEEKTTRPDVKFTEQQFFNKTFATTEAKVELPDEKSVCCWGLNDLVQTALGASKPVCAFDSELLMTSNAALSRIELFDIVGPYRKKPWPLLVLRDQQPDGTPAWRVMLCSISDGVQFERWLREKGSKSEEGRQMWLVRANGKRMAGDPLDFDHKLSRLLTQGLFFAGEFEILSYTPWKAHVEQWLGSLAPNERNEWVRFFEQDILMGSPPGYKESPLYSYLHPEALNMS